MRKQTICAIAVAAALGAAALAGCSAGQQADGGAEVPPGAAPVMPAGHEGRFEALGAAGCYGCHGAGDAANPMLAAAVALPDDHYEGGSADSQRIDAAHTLCNTCHVTAGTDAGGKE